VSIGLKLAGAMPSNQATSRVSNHLAFDALKPASGKTASVDDRAQERSTTAQADSFSDIVKRGDPDSAGKPVVGRDEGDGTRNWKAKGHSPWRSLDLSKPHRPDGQTGRGSIADRADHVNEANEAGPAPETGHALPVSTHQTIAIAGKGSNAPSADVPRAPAVPAVARAGADNPPKDVEQPRHQRNPVASEIKFTHNSPLRSTPQPEPVAEADGIKARTASEPTDQSRVVRRTAPGTIPASADRSEAKVTVLSSQVALAPAAVVSVPGLSSTGAAFVGSLKSEGALPQHAAEVTSLALDQHSASARPVTTLKFQLHPAELGTVTVKLTGSGDQLAIEVQVENSEARHRLSSDSESIVKVLRGMGYDIDRITVQQAPSTAAPAGGATSREDAFTAQDGRSGERQDQSWRQESGQRHDQNARSNSGGSGDRDETRGGAVYI
jgi:chemotaxis protein MotD